ncbi:hypothetical protein [Actinomadura rupiterrae]|uniref:hypothetical protein n=1 Tax=Actinomadura rupiterrae TaxID=559627 RepID=UPI0020A2B1B1|nr:hypothetical protein [Actinomadura rupiterrae]MCP2337013.1 hypothetical protein [Actinomadura rupiterrae]
MEPNPEPLRIADPRLMGGFTLLGRLSSHGAGTLFLAEDHRRAQVVLGVPYPTAAADPGVRARFASAVGALAENREIVASSTTNPPIWVAVPYIGGAVHDVLGLLDTTALSTAEPSPAHVPGFAPHWSPEPHNPPPVYAPAPRQSRAPLLIPVVALAAIVIAGAAVAYFVIADRSGSTTTADSPAPPRVAPDTPSTTPSPSTTDVPKLNATDDKAHVAGPSFGSGDKLYFMKLNGFPFNFNVPDEWGCMRSDKPPFSDRWICAHEGKGFPPTGGTSAGGLVAIQPCPSGCGPTQRESARNAMVITAKDWRATDPTTQYAEETGTNTKNEKVVRVAMSHVFASRQGGPIDTAVAVQLTGPPDEKEDMQKIINEIRRRTP